MVSALKLARPWMTEEEVRLLETELLQTELSHLEVLEWGSGGSTLHFTRFLREAKRSYRWLSLEYNRAWHRKVVKATRTDPHVEVMLFDVGNRRLRQRHTDMTGYIKHPASLGRRFNVIIVDGRKRRRCLLEAKALLQPNGVVLLHDAQRHYYRCALRDYPHGCFLTPRLWRGSLNQVHV